jgi:hypothetical protein
VAAGYLVALTRQDWEVVQINGLESRRGNPTPK